MTFAMLQVDGSSLTAIANPFDDCHIDWAIQLEDGRLWFADATEALRKLHTPK